MPDDSSTRHAVDVFASRVDYSLMVVTTGSREAEMSGCLAGFITKCSIEPPRFFLVCISKVNHTYFVAERSASPSCSTSSARIRSSWPPCSESRPVTSSTNSTDAVGTLVRNGAPVLDECAAWVEGAIMDSFPVGDHQAFLVRPVGGGSGRHKGVLTFQNSPSLQAGHPTS